MSSFEHVAANIPTLADLSDLAHIAAENVAAGDSLFSADLEGQASGTIVNAARAPGGGQDVSAVIQIDSAQHTVHWKTADGPQLQLQTLPYPVP